MSKPVGEERDGLILLFGMPRSGTTWAAKILDSHPDVLYRHEPEHVRPVEGLPVFIDPEDHEKYRDSIRQYAGRLAAMTEARVLAKHPLLPKRYMNRSQFRLFSLSTGLASAVARLSLRLPVYNPARSLPPASYRLLWKSVVSMGRLGAILAALPSARAIVVLRHPCGFVASQLRGSEEGRFGTGNRPKPRPLPRPLLAHAAEVHGVTEEELWSISREERQAWRWLITHEMALEQLRAHPRCMTVWYEDLCDSPLQGFRRLFDFAGLDWQEETESFLSYTTESHSEDYYSILRDPAAAARRWREELSPEVVDRIMKVVARNPVADRWTESSGGN